MKFLGIVRHAKSSWDDRDLHDFDRPLNKRGLNDAPEMGRRLRNRNIKPDLMVSSPAVRALTTCRIIAASIDYDESKIKTDERLYLASSSTLLKAVRNFPDQSNTVFIFGHNPGLTDFASALADEDIGNIPTAGVVLCRVHVQRWAETTWNAAEMIAFDYPKRRDQE